MSSKNTKAKNYNHQQPQSTKHNSGKLVATNSAPSTEKVILRPTHPTDLSRHTNHTKWLKFLKRDSEAEYKSLSEIFDPKNLFKFQLDPRPVKSRELLDHEMEKAVLQRRKPVPTTNPDVFAKGHDSDLHNTYLDEMLVFDQEMITYQSKLDTLTEVYSLELKAWSNKSRESVDKRKSLFTYAYRHISSESLMILEQKADFKKIEEDKDLERFLELINITHSMTPTADAELDRVKILMRYDRMRQRSNESLTEYKRRWDEETERYVAAGGSLRSDQIQALMFLQSLEEKPAVVQFKVDLSNNVMEGTGTYPASVSAMYNTLYQRKVVVQTASKPGIPGTVASSEFSFITTTVGKSSHAPKSTAGGGGKATSSQIKNAAPSNQGAQATDNPQPSKKKCDKPCQVCVNAGEPREKAMHWMSECQYIKDTVSHVQKKAAKKKERSLTIAELEREDESNLLCLRDYEDLDNLYEKIEEKFPPEKGSSAVLLSNQDLAPVQITSDTPESTVNTTTGETISDTVVAVFKSSPKINLKPTEWILDTGATMKQGGLAVHREAVSSIRKAAKKTELRGIGTLVVTKCCDLPRVADGIHFDPKGPANILAFYFLEDKFPTKYTREEKTFSFRITYGVWLTFKRHQTYLYVGDTADLEERCKSAPSEPLSNRLLISTVAENASKFTKREVDKAEFVSRLRKNAGFPSDRDLMASFLSGGILNNPLSPQDINRERAIKGPDVHALKGKSVSHKPEPVKVELIPRLIQTAQSLLIDLFFMNKLPFLVSKTMPLRYVIAVRLLTKNVAEVGKALLRMIGMYRSRGFAISAVLTDREPAVLALEQTLGDGGIKLQPASGDSVPVIERTIRVIKERSRSIRSTLPFRPNKQILIWLILFAANAINNFASRHSETKLCPNTLLSGFAPDYKKHFKFGFGDYVQAPNPLVTDETRNTLMVRTVGALVLLVQHTLEGSVKCMNLNTGHIITCRSGTLVPLPMPPLVCEYLSGLADSEAAKTLRPDTSDRERELFFEYRGAELQDDDIDSDDEDIFPGVGIDSVAPISGLHAVPEGDIPDLDLPTGESIPAFQDGSVESSIAGVDSHPSTTDLVTSDQQSSYSEEDLDHGGELPPLPLEPMEPLPAEIPIEPTSIELPIRLPLELQEQVREDLENPDLPSLDPTESHESANTEDLRPEISVPPARRAGLRSTTSYKDRKFYEPETGLHLTVNSALRKCGRKALESIVEEVHQIGIQKNVFKPVNVKRLTMPQLKKIIRSSIFSKEKFLSDDTFEKLKSRLVAGGNMQDKALYEDVSSPTVSTTAAFTIATIAASERRHVVTIDIPGAYLNADLDDKEPIHMRINKLEAAILMQLDPSFEIGKMDDGSCIVRLNKALYGLIESAKLWYEHLSGTLISLGFEVNPYEPCVFNIVKNGAQCSICFHVDDLLVTSKDPDNIALVHEGLSAVYGELTMKRGPKLSYLGMTLDFATPGIVKIRQEKFLGDMLRESGITTRASTPALATLFEIDPNSQLLEGEAKEQFHSTTAKLLYLAKRTRPEMLLLCSFLTTRVTCSTEEDQLKLLRGLRYLFHTQDLCLTLGASNPMEIIAFTDASFGIHANFMSHTGATITLGGGPIFAKSSKQKLVTKSSTEAELVGLSDSASQVIWTRNFLMAQGYQMNPAIIKQDNMSTLALAEKGRSTSERTRHVNIRYFFIKDRVNSGDLKLEYLPTSEMIADILTKPLQGEAFRVLRDALLNTHPVVVSIDRA